MSKFRIIPINLFSLLANIISLLLYLAGYTVWIIACQLYPDHPRLKDSWYGFDQFKEQSKTAAIIGVIAIIGCFISFVVPILLLPTLWLIVVSNVFWCISEYHKIKNPPTYDEEYSTSRQNSYLEYAGLMTGLSIFTAITTTIAFIFPPIAVVLFTVTGIVGLIVTLTALNCWFDFNFNKHIPDALEKKSYTLMSEQLGLPKDNTLSLNQSLITANSKRPVLDTCQSLLLAEQEEEMTIYEKSNHLTF